MPYSYDQYTAYGATQTFTVTFDYIFASHVEAYVDDVEDTTFTWPTSTTITLSAMPDNGAIVLIKRVTPKTARLVDFTNSSILDEATLDKDSNQAFFIAQEIYDEMADKMELDTADNKWDGESHPIKLVTDPTNAQDVATKNYVDTAPDSAVADCLTAQAAAEAAQTAAETAAATIPTISGGDALKLIRVNAGETAYEKTGTFASLYAAALDANTVFDNENQTFTKAQRASITTLTDGATVNTDLSLNNDFTLTLGGDRTIANPSNIVAGQSGFLYLIQDGTGNRVPSWGSYWQFEDDNAPVLSIAPTAVDVLWYTVEDATTVHCGLLSKRST